LFTLPIVAWFIDTQGVSTVETRLTHEELAILGWIYGRAKGFGKEDGYWAASMTKDLGMNELLYKRASSLLRELGFVRTESGESRAPNQKDGPPEKGEWISLTAAGVLAYRQWAPQDDWLPVPDRFKDKPEE
jgi:hypothetical protein